MRARSISLLKLLSSKKEQKRMKGAFVEGKKEKKKKESVLR